MIKSEKKTAIKALLKQREKLEDNDIYKSRLWAIKTSEIVRKYFGETSGFFTHSQKFDSQAMTKNTSDFLYFKDKFKSSMQTFIDECIDYINTNGVFKDHSTNFLSTVKVDWLVAGAIALVNALFWGGYFFSELNHKTEKQEMKAGVEELQKKITTLSDSITLLKATKDSADKNAQPKGSGK
jgi:phosphoribosyl-ATP pyrophosphohydrolase